MAENEYDILIGEVVSTFGHKGEVKVYPHTDFPERLSSRTEVFMRLDGVEPRMLKIRKSRINKNVVIIQFDGYNDMTDAESLRGAKLYTSKTAQVPLPEGEFYIDDIIGIRVFTSDGDDLGVVNEVLRSPANDVYVTDRAMIPAVKEFVVSLDIKEKKMVVKPVEGLVQD
ncbi:MAG: ribosome maturation factor RimM [Armatimonadota bacterium]